MIVDLFSGSGVFRGGKFSVDVWDCSVICLFLVCSRVIEFMILLEECSLVLFCIVRM